MKNPLNNRFLIAVAIVLAIAGFAYSAASLYEIEGILALRSNNPQIRVNGQLSFVKTVSPTTPAIVGMGRPVIVTNAATRTLTFAECGAIVIANGVATPGTQTFTLPSATTAGCKFTFINGIADGTQEIRVLGVANAACVVTDTVVPGADFDSGILTQADCRTGFKNTGASNAVDDNMTIVSDGLRWLGVGYTTGIWATL